ncbi:MAG: heme-binding beta-barrel domain-containing protein [Rhodanobacter sp.]
MITRQENEANLVGLGPLGGLIGIWEGTGGTDCSPGMPDHLQNDTEKNYRERWEFSLIDPPVENHDQKLRQLVCDTYASRGTTCTAGKKAGEPFRAQLGYWIWDAQSKQLLNSFAVPRGIVINAAGYGGSGRHDVQSAGGRRIGNLWHLPESLPDRQLQGRALRTQTHPER